MRVALTVAMNGMKLDSRRGKQLFQERLCQRGRQNWIEQEKQSSSRQIKTWQFLSDQEWIGSETAQYYWLNSGRLPTTKAASLWVSGIR
jgi:hypothetical protein